MTTPTPGDPRGERRYDKVVNLDDQLKQIKTAATAAAVLAALALLVALLIMFGVGVTDLGEAF